MLQMRHVSAALVLSAVFLVVASLAGLVEPPVVSAQGTPVTVMMGERGAQYFFEPAQIQVPAGQVQFSFRNNGQRPHNFVITAGGAAQRTPDLDPTRTAEQTFTFSQPGTYEAICDLPTHAQRGMRMSVVVTAADGSGTTGTTGTAGQAGTTGTTGATGTTGTAGQAGTTGASGAAGGTTGATGAGSATNAQAPDSSGLSLSARGLPYFISLLIHIPAAVTWLGIVLYDAIVATVPFLTPAQRGSLLRRPWWLVLLTIPLFGLTGIYQTIYNPFSTITDYASLANLRYTTAYGNALFWKHGFVFASMALTLALTFWFAPKLVAFADDIRPEAVTPSRLPNLVAAANVVACLALVACVAVMVFQLH